MKTLSEIIVAGEAYLVARVMQYAERLGYARYTPSQPEVWKSSIRGLSAGLESALSASTEIPELSPELELDNDRITAFGVEQARKHRSRGVTLEMFLGLMKYFRQSYHDLIDTAALAAPARHRSHTYTDRYFDRIELGFIAEWERTAAERSRQQEQQLLARNAELAAVNTLMHQEILDRKRAEQLVSKLNADLERRVVARTVQLQRLNEQNHYKLRELLLLNRFSRLNLSTTKLNRLTYLMLTTLTSEPQLFFERAMLFLLNERTGILQGMIGVVARQENGSSAGEEDRSETDEELAGETGLRLSKELKASRIVLKRGKSVFYRAVTENRVMAMHNCLESEDESAEFCRRFAIDSLAIMPVTVKNRNFGVVVVDNPHTGRSIGRNDFRFLQLFAHHASIAVENLVLYTDLEDANRQLREAQEQIMHGERLATIGELSAGIAHELKGPLIAIGGFARRLSRKIPPESVEGGYVATIVEEGERLEKMLEQILSFSRKTTICYELCGIEAVVEGALSIILHAVEKNRVVLQKSFPKKEIMLYGDAQQLKQVFINLFHNALDVMPGGGTLAVTILPAQLDKRSAVAVKIADTGSGISEELKHCIFNPFFTTKSKGTGLGLPITNRIVANHGGKIRVRNRATGGAEFTVLFPCA